MARRSKINGLVAMIVLVATGAGLWLARDRLGLRKLDINEVGGVVLVYEFDRQQPLDAATMKQCQENVQRRMQEIKVRQVNVRTLGNNKLEIVIPRNKDLPGDVHKVKSMLSRSGTLEFRILANLNDDGEVFAAIESKFADAANNPEFHQTVEKAAMTGAPPPVPQRTDGLSGWQLFPHQKRTQTRAEYAWVEVGQQELISLGLDNACEDPAEIIRREVELAKKNGANYRSIWQKAAEARKRGQPLVVKNEVRGDRELFLLFSRRCVSTEQSLEERERKKFEYFFLTRLPDKDEITGQDLAVTGAEILDVGSNLDRFTKQPAITFRLSLHGGERMHLLTSQNEPGPEKEFLRSLAVIFDGRIISAPTLQSAVRDDCVITGDFSQQEIDAMVGVLRAGALPVPLKPLPVQESIVEPKPK
jgi:preprotein translocase subunit SecD